MNEDLLGYGERARLLARVGLTVAIAPALFFLWNAIGVPGIPGLTFGGGVAQADRGLVVRVPDTPHAGSRVHAPAVTPAKRRPPRTRVAATSEPRTRAVAPGTSSHRSSGSAPGTEPRTVGPAPSAPVHPAEVPSAPAPSPIAVAPPAVVVPPVSVPAVSVPAVVPAALPPLPVTPPALRLPPLPGTVALP